MDLMKPIASRDTPSDEDQFLYEVKYDGFRAVLIWDKDGVQLMSRNDVDLTKNFPEIIAFCEQVHDSVVAFLPLILDGELVVLNNPYEANFSLIQLRGRLKNHDKISTVARKRPATFSAFDLLQYQGAPVNDPYENRKRILKSVMKSFLNQQDSHKLQFVEGYDDQDELWQIVNDFRGEGVISKRIGSSYGSGKRHHDWFKIKNWRTIQCFLTFYNPNNGYFTVCVFHNNQVIQVGKCKHGLGDEELKTLQKLFMTNGKQIDQGYELPPAICATIHTLDLYDKELREPEFVDLLPNTQPEECTYKQMQIDLAMMPSSVSLSNIEKIFWPQILLTKGDLLVYLRLIYPYMIPFLKHRILTVIRSPDGVEEEFFYQKSLPSYAPSFMKETHQEEIICNDCASLIWLANHGAIEYHVPFQTKEHHDPAEVVFDLDPPNREGFGLAVDAALLIKRLIDNLDLVSFVKTSGNKGLQIHIPLPSGAMTYEDTAVFTEAIATTLVREHPNLFTIERMKKNRKDRLYIDYVQHGKGKTIVAPYSPRKTADATVATPLFWNELKSGLTPDEFTINNVVERVRQLGCPFSQYAKVREEQNVEQLLKMIRS